MLGRGAGAVLYLAGMLGWSLSFASLAASQLISDVCIVGYVMDTFCIERGTLLDNPSVETLRNPELHSMR